jgi:phosphoglucosamine mutase
MPEGRYKLFGTDGIRGIAGQFPLDNETIARIGRALVNNLEREPGRPVEIVIGRDTRESGPEIETWLARGIAAAGAKVQSAGVITTPGVAYITRTTPFDAGVVISASHNPYRDNGIKVFSPTGRKLPDEVERRIEEELASLAALDLAASAPRPYYRAKEAEYRGRYMDYLVSEVSDGLSFKGMRLALDCANGAASQIAPEVFRRLGAEIEVINAEPDGSNINENCGSLHVEGLQRAVAEKGLDLGVAFDGDADRALFIDSSGKLVDGDAALFVIGDYMNSRGLLAGDTVVATVMSNIGLEIALNERGITLVRTSVGDRFVLEELLAGGYRLGGEQSGHIIFPAISLAGDGIITAIELLRVVKERGRPLNELASQMKRYPQVLVNVRVGSKPALETVPEIKAEMEKLEEELQGKGRLLVRYSGTENLARVMIEGEQQRQIEDQANRLADIIRLAIGG